MPSLPPLFLDRIRSFLNAEDYDSVLRAFSETRQASFRINTLKAKKADVLDELRTRGISCDPHPTIPDTFLVPKEHEYALKWSQSFYGGKIYVQGVASMLPALSLDLAPGMRVLDACAAPGSKTTQIGALLKNQGVIVACEKQKIRSEKLTYNLRLQGVTIARVHNMDLQIFSQHHPDYLFDRILIDAPCSAEGRISLLDEKTFGFWTEENIQKKALIQTQLIETAAQHLVHNAILVYATCTLAPEENECIIDTFLEKNQDFSLVPAGLPLIPELRPGLSNFKNKSFNHDLRSCARILPSKTTEGFFIAKLHKLK